MKRSIFSPPEAFGVSPLLALLPVKGDISRLQTLTASLYARFEAVSAARRDMDESTDRETRRRVSAEEAMLKRVLDWLAVKPQEGR